MELERVGLIDSDIMTLRWSKIYLNDGTISLSSLNRTNYKFVGGININISKLLTNLKRLIFVSTKDSNISC